MGIFFIILLIWLLNKYGKDRAKSDIGKMIFGIWILFAILSSIFSSPLAFIIIAVVVLYQIYKKNREKGEQSNWQDKYGWDSSQWEEQLRKNRQNYDTTYKSQKTTSYILPKAVSKRTKIIKDFNKKFNLYLTDEQIKSIVNSTYMSEGWKREVEAMTQKYETIYEWFQGGTRWLRVYLYVFHVQDVTSDLAQQENIVTAAFEQVFRYVDTLGNLSTAEKIERVNSKYMSAFDDVTFMIAYRFLQFKGFNHSLQNPDIVQTEDSDIDELLRKYDRMEQNGSI